MTPTETGKAYDTIAGRWADPAFPQSNGIAQHERALAFATRNGWALDVGCGSSGRIIALLLRRGFAVEGVDVSERMIELARRRHADVALHVADICKWTLPRRYNFISAWDCLWHVPLTSQKRVLRKLLNGLEPGGLLVLSMGGVDAPGEKTDSAMGPALYYAALGIPRTLEVIADCGCVCRHLEYDQWPESHAYAIAQKR
jgi:SAM-dependent methyltransferase